MKIRSRLLALAAAALSLGSVAAAQAPAPEFTVFRNVNVIPMDTAEPRVLPAHSVVVRGERIATIGPAASVAIPPGARVIDGGGRYLMPGLAEMHAHVPGGADARYLEEVLFLYVANGVTTARGMLGEPSHLALRERIQRQQVLGPRLYTSGPSLNNPATSPEATARMVREQAAAGYDFIKVHPGPSRAAYDAAVEAARTSSTRLAGHVPAEVGLQRALDAGQATIDHLDGYVEALTPPAQRSNPGFFGLNLAEAADRSRITELVEATVRSGTWNVPTQTLIEHWPAPEPSVEALLARPEMAFVSPQLRSQWANAKRQQLGAPGYSPDRARALVALRRQLVKALHEGGAGLLLGSDAPQVFNVPGFSLHREIAAMIAAGLTPYEVLRTGTANPAKFFNAEQQFGSVREGLAADLLLLAANPLVSPEILARPEGVMVRGRWLDRATLDQRLGQIAERYRQ